MLDDQGVEEPPGLGLGLAGSSITASPMVIALPPDRFGPSIVSQAT